MLKFFSCFFRKQFIYLSLLTMFLFGCDSWLDTNKKTDYDLAVQAYSRHEIADTEMYFQRFLRKNPSSELRWEVWMRMLNISLNIRQEKITAAAYLEIMLEEFQEDGEKRRTIEKKLASICNDLQSNERAIYLWEQLINDNETPPEDKAEAFRNLSQAYLKRLEISQATDALKACLKLNVKASTKGDCLYDMAETQILTDKLELAAKSLEDLLLIDDISEYREILARFTLGDAYEQQEKYSKALEQFLSIRNKYPNKMVIEQRIGYLQKRLNKAAKKR